MSFEKNTEEINYEELISKSFGGDAGLEDKIKEVIENKKDLELYTPDFARAVADSVGLGKDFPIIKLMIKIKKVWPPDLPLDEKRFLGELAPQQDDTKTSLFKNRKKLIEDSKFNQLREQKRSGDDDPEDYIYR